MPDSPATHQHEHLTVEERKEHGREARKKVPRSSHADWSPAADRPDPLDVLTAQDQSRLQELVPIRHGRMSESPFAFYRGAAAIMAGDLAPTPVSGIDAQLCGDAHLSNYGAFASPNRTLVFDVNDFDETLPGPWEWDLKRLTASFALAGRANGLGHKATRDAVMASAEAYRTAMAYFAKQAALDVWYAQLSVDQLTDALDKKSDRKRLSKSAAKARSKNNLKAMTKLTERADGALRIASSPPLLVPLRNIAGDDANELRHQVEQSWELYRSSITDDRKALLNRYRMIDVALKVVGVGSVGTRCLLALFEGRDEQDPLFLQVKEAGASVLEAHLKPSTYDTPGERVVQGQRLIQASGDTLLGWSSSEAGHHYYWRQYHDMKGSADVETMSHRRLGVYAQICGWSLAHAHARSSDPVAISGYLGTGTVMDRALTEFAFTYADQNDLDFASMTEAIDDGRMTAEDG